MWLAIAWRNLWRQPVRTILSIASIAFTTALLVFALSFQFGVYAALKSNVLRLFDGFAELRPHGYGADPDFRKTLPDPQRLAADLREIAGIGAAAPRIITFAILAHGKRSFGAAVIGVDPASEPHVSTLARTVRRGRYLAPRDSDAAVIGDALARNLALSPGDRVTLLGSGFDGSVAADVLHVVGTFHSGMSDLDRQTLEMPLTRAQETFVLGERVNVIAVSGETLADVNAALPAIQRVAARHGAEVADWETLEPSLRDAIALDITTGILLYAGLVVVVVFIILNTLFMSVLERTREFGILLALGIRPGQVGMMVWLELITLALAGTGLGIAMGAAITAWFEARGIAYSGAESVLAQFGLPERLYPALSPATALAGPAVILISIIIAGIVPYLHVLRLQPASAMRAN
jgi:ABC-type lipoprotein release transport system permease subunit